MRRTVGCEQLIPGPWNPLCRPYIPRQMYTYHVVDIREPYGIPYCPKGTGDGKTWQRILMANLDIPLTSCGFGSWILISSTMNSVMKHIASFPGRLHITWSIKKWREKAFRIVPRDPQHGYYRCHHTSQQPLSCTRLILHSVLATKIGQALAENYTECIKHTQAKSHDSKGLLSDKYET